MATFNLPLKNLPDVQSARTLVKVALVFYGIFGLFLILAGAFFVLFLVMAVLSFIMLFVVNAYVQEPLKRGDVSGASSPTLVLGIISVLITNLISGILLLVAYGKISRAEAALRAGSLGGPYTVGVAPSPALGPSGSDAPRGGARYCPSCGSPLTPTDRYCPNCGTTAAPAPGTPGND